MGIVTRSEEETLKVAEKLSGRIDRGTLILLSGDLGAGKTRFVKGIARGLGVKEVVTSPTFTIVNRYSGRIPLFHVDLYRLEGFPGEDVDLDEMLEEGAVAVEWWERDNEFFKSYKPRIEVNIRFIDENTREIEIRWVE